MYGKKWGILGQRGINYKSGTVKGKNLGVQGKNLEGKGINKKSKKYKSYIGIKKSFLFHNQTTFNNFVSTDSIYFCNKYLI